MEKKTVNNLDPEKLSYAFFGRTIAELAQDIYKEFNKKEKVDQDYKCC